MATAIDYKLLIKVPRWIPTQEQVADLLTDEELFEKANKLGRTYGRIYVYDYLTIVYAQGFKVPYIRDRYAKSIESVDSAFIRQAPFRAMVSSYTREEAVSPRVMFIYDPIRNIHHFNVVFNLLAKGLPDYYWCHMNNSQHVYEGEYIILYKILSWTAKEFRDLRTIIKGSTYVDCEVLYILVENLPSVEHIKSITWGKYIVNQVESFISVAGGIKTEYTTLEDLVAIVNDNKESEDSIKYFLFIKLLLCILD